MEAEKRIQSVSQTDAEDPASAQRGAYIHALALARCQGQVSVYGLSGALVRPAARSTWGPVNAMYRGARVAAAMMPISDVHRHTIELPAMRKRGIRLKKGEGFLGISLMILGHYRSKLSGEALKLVGSAEFWASCLGAAGESPEEALGRQHRAALKRGESSAALNDQAGSSKSEKNGFEVLADGVHQGLLGLWDKPMAAAKKGNAVEVVASFGQGVVGLFAKPASGLLQMGHSVADGAFNQSKSSGCMAGRVRLPRAVYTDGVLRAYDAADAGRFAALLARLRAQDEDPSSPSTTPRVSAADGSEPEGEETSGRASEAEIARAASHRGPAISPRRARPDSGEA